MLAYLLSALARRRNPIIAVAVVLLLLFTVSSYYRAKAPDYSLVRAFQKQRDDQISSETAARKFVRFNQLQSSGFAYQLQEILVLSYFAARAGRSYVYQDLFWQPRKDDIPLAAFVDLETLAPQSFPVAHNDHFENECSEIDHVSVHDLPFDSVSGRMEGALRASVARCVEVTSRDTTLNYLQSTAPLDFYSEMYDGILRNFHFSANVEAATNALLMGMSVPVSNDNNLKLATGTMVIHVRRGDFSSHCKDLYIGSLNGGTKSKPIPHPPYAWSRLRPSHDLMESTTWKSSEKPFDPRTIPQDRDEILSHCNPSMNRIAKLTLALAHDYTLRTRRPIQHLHIASNGNKVELAYLKKQLDSVLSSFRSTSSNGDFRISTTADLNLAPELADLDVAVDMDLAKRADVFVGNAYSSISVTVAALRDAKEVYWF